MVKPMFPYINDAINHLIFYQQHLATVHFEDGAYHVHTEVSNDVKNSDSNEDIPLSKKPANSSEHLVILADKQCSAVLVVPVVHALFNCAGLSAGDLHDHYPPPRV